MTPQDVTPQEMEQTGKDLNALLGKRDIAKFSHVDQLYTFTQDLPDGAAARDLLKTFQIAEGWAVDLDPKGSFVTLLNANGKRPLGHVGECEALLDDGRALVVRPNGRGGLGAWLFGNETAPAGWKDVSVAPPGGFLMQERCVLGTASAPGPLKYRIYWQDEPGFGLRQAAAVFAGFQR